MRILQLHAGYRTPAGEDTVVAAEADVLRAAGHEVVQHIEHNPTAAAESVVAVLRSRRNRRAEATVRRRLEQWQPDVAHLHNTWFALSSSVIDAVADHSCPLVMTVHNYRLGCLTSTMFRDAQVCTACVGRSPLRGVLHGCYRESRVLSGFQALEIMSARRRHVLDRIDRFVAPSRFMADRLIDIGLPEDRLVVKPHFIEAAGPRDTDPSTSDEVLFIGRLAVGKGLPTLLRAWEIHADRLRSADVGGARQLTIIGDGPLLGDLREAAPRGVTFAGWLPRDEVRQRMLSARAFVFPSEWYEPFGMVLLEAMSAGLPVVATTSSDAARITMTPGELVVPAADERALADALGELSDGFVDEAGTAARRRYEEHYSPAIGLQDLETLYRDVIADRAAGRTSQEDAG